MVSIAIMVGEVIINATAFFGGSYLAKYFTGDHNKADEDKKQHDLVVEKYQVPYKKYQASWLDCHKWQNQRAVELKFCWYHLSFEAL